MKKLDLVPKIAGGPTSTGQGLKNSIFHSKRSETFTKIGETLQVSSRAIRQAGRCCRQGAVKPTGRFYRPLPDGRGSFGLSTIAPVRQYQAWRGSWYPYSYCSLALVTRSCHLTCGYPEAFAGGIV